MEKGYSYPPMPQGIDERVIMPSADFKREVVKVAGAIAFFAAVYVGLMLAAVGLAVLCGYAGYFLVSLYPAFITFMLGLGLVGIGLLVIFFLLKFIFKRTKTDRSGMIEITEVQQPELFSFIRNITHETVTPFPKRVYLSADVNAAVFYDSSFWSMFFPVRKNLVIGLGLVNSVNITEFKAVLAHEFGHFSQRSMKLGSYVYHVNQTIYNLLYDNEGYGKVLEKWSNISGYFALFAGVTVKIVQAIQWVLKKAYVVVNKPYMSLSRQMEFHADSVAAFVSGSEPLISCLRRIEAADICYDQLLKRYNVWLADNLKADNMYLQHQEMMLRFSADFNIPMSHGFLQVTGKALATFNQSRLVIKDQWASHPSTDDREAHLKSLNIPTVLLHDPAWVLFRNPEELQQQMTDHIYASAKFETAPMVLSLAGFSQRFSQDIQDRSFDKAYNGFYDDRQLTPFNLEEGADLKTADGFGDIFSEANGTLQDKVSCLESDIQIVKQIQEGGFDIKTFDFDGRKYTSKEAPLVLQELEQELQSIQEKLNQLDQQAFSFFYQKAQEVSKEDELLLDYQKLFEATAQAEADTKLYEDIYDTLNFLFNNSMTIEGAKNVVKELKQKEEPILLRVQQLLQEPTFIRCLTEQQQSFLMKIVDETREYIQEDGFIDANLNDLTEGLQVYLGTTWEKCFQIKKDLLAQQMKLIQHEDKAHPQRTSIY